MRTEVDGVAGVGQTSHARKELGKSVRLTLSAVAGTVAANYQTCHETAEQLRVLQTRIREMKFAAEQ